MNMANTLYVMGLYDEALECLNDSLKYFEEKRNIDLLNENRIIEGNLYLKMNNLNKLKDLSVKMRQSTKNDKIMSFAYMFEVLAMEGTGPKVIDSINKAVAYAERSQDNAVLKQALCMRIDYYERNKKGIYAALDRDRIASL